MSNPIGLEGGRNDLSLKDYNFMPVIEIKPNTPWET